MASVRVSDIDVHYTETGSGPPLVLLHGGLATSEMWNTSHVALLATRYRVFMPDSRGHGKTTNPAGTLSYPQLADDAAGFCSALDLRSPVFVGYSDGGQAGIEIGLRHPTLARAFVLGGVVTKPSDAYFAALAKMGITTPGEVNLDTMRSEFGEMFDYIVSGPHANWESFVKQIATLWLTVPTYTPEELSRIATPCLVICGDRDTGSADDAIPLFRALPLAELAIVPQSKHGAASKQMFWVNVIDFLSRHAS